jgi:hypothetical protein
MSASEREIAGIVRPFMLLRANVLNVKDGVWKGVLGQLAVFAFVVGPDEHHLTGSFVHQG